VIILDTNVLSEPLKHEPEPAVLIWLDAQAPETLFLTTVCLAELLSGVDAMPAGRRRTSLRESLERQVDVLFGDRILSFDRKAADAFARVHTAALKSGNSISFADCAIAAVAKAHKFAVATRNVRDFKGTGVTVIDPWHC
jgi:toxin FitB